MGFNPCFCGSTSQVYITGNYYKFSSGVSILVFVEVRLRSTISSKTGSRHTRFQSLFLWKYVSGLMLPLSDVGKWGVSILVFVEVRLRLGIIGHCRMMQLCFNPCFCGSTSQVPPVYKRSFILSMFQSLFLWKYVSGLLCLHPRPPSSFCFNPCFCGSTSQVG